MKKFAIIGGSFNPVTKAHVEIGQIAARELPGWQILYIPAPDRFLTSWKAMEKNDILSGEQRLNLLRKAVEPHGFLCEDCEVHLKTIWYKAEGIFELSRFLVIPRDGDEPEKMIKEIPFLKERRDRILISHEPRIYPDFSATKVRESIKAGDGKWKEMVPKEIAADLEALQKL